VASDGTIEAVSLFDNKFNGAAMRVPGAYCDACWRRADDALR